MQTVTVTRLEWGGSDEMLTAAIHCNAEAPAIDAERAALLVFVRKVTDDSQAIVPADMDLLRHAGWSDLQIAEAIHMAALFACFNRVVNAFGLPSQGMLALNGDTR